MSHFYVKQVFKCPKSYALSVPGSILIVPKRAEFSCCCKKCSTNNPNSLTYLILNCWTFRLCFVLHLESQWEDCYRCPAPTPGRKNKTPKGRVGRGKTDNKHHYSSMNTRRNAPTHKEKYRILDYFELQYWHVLSVIICTPFYTAKRKYLTK